MSPPKVLVVIPSNAAANALVTSGAMGELTGNTAVSFVFAPAVSVAMPPNSKRLELECFSSGFNTRLDRLFWFHALYEYMRAHGFRDEDSFKVAALRPVMRRFHELLALRPFAWLPRVIDARYFRYDINAREVLSEIRPDLIVIPGVALDNYSHMVLRTAQTLKIPSAMIISHWDYFTKKGLLRVKPDRVYVWGEDMHEAAVTRNGVPNGDVKIVGAPQFEKYLTPLPDKAFARSALGVSTTSQWILFPGAGLPYDEVSVIKELSDLLKKNGEDIGIIYRPHPRAWERRIREAIALDKLGNVFVDDPKESGCDDDHYRFLMAAADAVISPYSTMVLEGGLCGLPALCISFSDGVNPWDFSQVTDFDHIAAIIKRHWIVPCADRSDLGHAFEVLLKMMRQPELKKTVVTEVSKTVFFDERTYASRLWCQIEADFFRARGH